MRMKPTCTWNYLPSSICVLIDEYSKNLSAWVSSPGMQLFLDRNQSNPYSIKFYFTFWWLPHFDIQYLSSPVNVPVFSLTISFSSYYCTVWRIRAKNTSIFSCQDRVKGRFLFHRFWYMVGWHDKLLVSLHVALRKSVQVYRCVNPNPPHISINRSLMAFVT